MIYQSLWRNLRALLALAILAVGTRLDGATETDEVKLALLFTNGAVLQQEFPLPVWGWAAAGAAVEVSLAGQTQSARTDDKGRWQVTFQPLRAKDFPDPLTMTVTSGDRKIVISDLLVGEVWLCSGQSNMGAGGGRVAWARTRSFIPADERSPLARTCSVGLDGGPDLRGFLTPQDGRDLQARWGVTSGASTADWFGRMLQAQLGVPVGIVHCSRGATNIESWISEEGTAGDPEVAAAYKKELLGYAPILQEIREHGTAGPFATIRIPSGNYNAGIHSLIPFAMRGVVWYQGEQNRGVIYQRQMATMMADWRKRWQRPDLPIIFAQITTGSPVGFPTELLVGPLWGFPAVSLLESQRVFAQTDGQAWMAPNIDLSGGVHPSTKPDIAARLVLGALAARYGRELESSGPTFRAVERTGNQVRLLFDHAEGLFAAESLTVNSEARVIEPVASNEVVQLGEDGVFVLNLIKEGKSKGLAMRKRPNQTVRGIYVLTRNAVRKHPPYTTTDWIDTQAGATWRELPAQIDGTAIVVTVPEDTLLIAGGLPTGTNPVRISNVYNAAELPLINFVASLDPATSDQPSYWTRVVQLAALSDEALLKVLQAPDRPTSEAIADTLLIRDVLPAQAIRDAILAMLQAPRLQTDNSDQLFFALNRWPRDPAVATVIEERLAEFRDGACLDYLVALRPPADRMALFRHALLVGNGSVLDAALANLVAADRWDLVAEAMAEAKGRHPGVLAGVLLRRFEKDTDPAGRKRAVAIIGDNLRQEDTFCLGGMVGALGRFGADAAPYLDALKAIDVSRDPRWLGGVPEAIKIIENAIKAKEKEGK